MRGERSMRGERRGDRPKYCICCNRQDHGSERGAAQQQRAAQAAGLRNLGAGRWTDLHGRRVDVRQRVNVPARSYRSRHGQDFPRFRPRIRSNPQIRTKQMGPNHCLLTPHKPPSSRWLMPPRQRQRRRPAGGNSSKMRIGSYRCGRDTATQQIGRPCQVCNARVPAYMELPPEGVLHCRKLSAKSNSRKYYVKKAKSNQAPD
jgi:hypothetical protein